MDEDVKEETEPDEETAPLDEPPQEPVAVVQ
jgi:hypothetical protein